MRALVLSGLLVTLVAGRMVSQRLPPPLFPSARTHDLPGAAIRARVASEPNIGSPLLAAAGLGLLGWGVGAVAGHAIQGDCFEEYCGLEGIFYGGAAGGGMGLAVGAHLGNRRRGSFPLDVLTSGAVWGVGYALMSSFANDGDGAGVVLTAIMLPPTQLVATVLVERATGRSRAGRLQAP
ncbi:MAG: hypothetical protein DMD55_19535 [Gemmatimonadetes bacterium]|nr:MAG: hypothetical protein DMD55_19535 [Gemmatimonadota bacterium]